MKILRSVGLAALGAALPQSCVIVDRDDTAFCGGLAVICRRSIV